MSLTLCIESHYHFLPFQSWILHHNFSTGGLKLNRARIPNCPSRSETAFALMEKGSEQCIIQRALYSTSDGDDVSWVTHTGPCVYDPLTLNIIPMSPAPPALLDDGIRILNYQWLDFIKADQPNWGLSEGGMRRWRRRRCHRFTRSSHDNMARQSLDVCSIYHVDSGHEWTRCCMWLMQHFSKHVERWVAAAPMTTSALSHTK